MAGRDPGLPQHLADLFPDRLVDSELGEIREGWKVSEIGEEVDAVGGATPSTKEPAYWNEGEQHWATPKDLSRSYCRQCCWKRTGRSPTRAWGLSRSGVKNYSKRGRWSRK